jgi:multisubunit Na+/H+ antiporter MnhB subunit
LQLAIKTARFQPLLSGRGAATSKNAGSAGLVVFITVATALQRLCFEASSIILLVWIYGLDRVSAQHLRIAKHKPALLVSNGDILYGKSFILYLIGVVMWLALTFILLHVAFRLLPERERNGMNRRSQASLLATLTAVCLFFAIEALPAIYSALVAAIALAGAFALAWARESDTTDNFQGK